MDNKFLLCVLLLLAGALRVTGQSGLADTVRQEGEARLESAKSLILKSSKPLKDTLNRTISKFTRIKRDTSTHWEIALQNSFVQDVDSSYFGEGLFSDYSIRRNMTFAGIPLGLEGHLVLQNSVVNKRFSGVKVAFGVEFNYLPYVAVTPANAQAATDIAKFYIDHSVAPLNPSNQTWTLKANGALAASTTYKFYYQIKN